MSKKNKVPDPKSGEVWRTIHGNTVLVVEHENSKPGDDEVYCLFIGGKTRVGLLPKIHLKNKL